MEYLSEVSLLEMIVEVMVLLVFCCGVVFVNIMVVINVIFKEKFYVLIYFYYFSFVVFDLLLGKKIFYFFCEIVGMWY